MNELILKNQVLFLTVIIYAIKNLLSGIQTVAVRLNFFRKDLLVLNSELEPSMAYYYVYLIYIKDERGRISVI